MGAMLRTTGNREMDRTLILPEIASYFGIQTYTVFEWIGNDELNATNVSNAVRPKYRVDQAEFEAFKLRNRLTPGEKPPRRALTPAPLPVLTRSRNMGRTFTTSEIIKYLRVTKRTVLNWIHSGELRATNVSNSARPRYRIEEADFEEFKLRRSSRSEIPTSPERRSYPPATLPPHIANRERSS